MKIQTVTLHNWRSVKDVTITFQDSMVFIGQNNHGKSNILYALLFFFGQIPLDGIDFNSNSNELFVEITFADLDQNDKTTFHKYVTNDNTIRVKKHAYKCSGIEYHGYLEIPSEDWLNEGNIQNYIRREVAASLPLAYLLPESGRISKDDFKPEIRGQIVFDICSPPTDPNDPPRILIQNLFQIHDFVRNDVYPRFAKLLEPEDSLS